MSAKKRKASEMVCPILTAAAFMAAIISSHIGPPIHEMDPEEASKSQPTLENSKIMCLGHECAQWAVYQQMCSMSR